MMAVLDVDIQHEEIATGGWPQDQRNIFVILTRPCPPAMEINPCGIFPLEAFPPMGGVLGSRPTGNRPALLLSPVQDNRQPVRHPAP